MYDHNKVEDFLLRSQNIVNTYDNDEAFVLISAEINSCENQYLNEYITALHPFHHEKVLDWIESNAHRITKVSLSWGHLAVSSHFDWVKADNWLTKGRPWSLIALDALAFCTTIGERLNQSLWMQEHKPKLNNHPHPDVIAIRLQKYLLTDSVPRTKRIVNQIIENVFDANQ